MPQFHIRFDIPTGHPYDTDFLYWNFLGNVILPFIQELKPSRFMFTRYGQLNDNPHMFVRYESDTIATKLLQEPHSHHEWDIAKDLSVPRFYGDNRRNHDQLSRGDLVFDFLHKASLLTLDQLSHKNDHGYWELEGSVDRNNNHYGWPLESIHHLFCNLSGVPTPVVIVPHAPANHLLPFQLMSPLYARMSGLDISAFPVIPVRF